MKKESAGSVANDGKGFHALYLWGLLYVCLTYVYPVIWYLTLPKPDETVSSQAAYDEFAKTHYGPLGENLSLLVLGIPLLLLLLNIIIVASSKKQHRKVFLNTARIIKYLLIPFYAAGAVLIVLLFLFMFTPVVIMIFVSPVIIGILCVLGWISLIGSAPFMFAYLSRSVKDGKNGKFFAFLVGFFQFFFTTDVIGTIICAIKEKKS